MPPLNAAVKGYKQGPDFGRLKWSPEQRAMNLSRNFRDVTDTPFTLVNLIHYKVNGGTTQRLTDDMSDMHCPSWQRVPSAGLTRSSGWSDYM